MRLSFSQCRSKVREQKIGEVINSTHERIGANLLNKAYWCSLLVTLKAIFDRHFVNTCVILRKSKP